MNHEGSFLTGFWAVSDNWMTALTLWMMYDAFTDAFDETMPHHKFYNGVAVPLGTRFAKDTYTCMMAASRRAGVSIDTMKEAGLRRDDYTKIEVYPIEIPEEILDDTVSLI